RPSSRQLLPTRAPPPPAHNSKTPAASLALPPSLTARRFGKVMIGGGDGSASSARVQRGPPLAARCASKEDVPTSPSPAPSMQDLPIRLLNSSQVLSEPILVHRITGGHIPEAASIWRNLISQNQLAIVPPEFQLEIDEDHLAFTEEWLQHTIHFQRQALDLRHLFRSRQFHQANMVIGDERVTQCIVLVIPFHDCRFDRVAFFEAEALRHTSRH